MVMTGRPTVLFACPDNGGISLLAEAFAFHARPDLRAFSAAASAPGIADPALLACLDAARIPADGLRPKPAGVFAMSGAPRLDMVVTFGEPARRALRGVPLAGVLRMETWRLADVRAERDLARRRDAYLALLPQLAAAMTGLQARIAPGMAA